MQQHAYFEAKNIINLKIQEKKRLCHTCLITIYIISLKLPEINGLCSQQSVTFSSIGQWQQIELTFILIISKVMAVNLGVDFHIRKWTW